MIKETLGIITANISFFIGFLAICIIFAGVLQTMWIYVFKHHNLYMGRLRLILNTHLILGLDLFIGKDVIDTFIAHSNEIKIQDLGILVLLILIRVFLSYFLEKEIKKLSIETKNKSFQKMLPFKKRVL